jgi:hypothetical protein
MDGGANGQLNRIKVIKKELRINVQTWCIKKMYGAQYHQIESTGQGRIA